MKYIIGIDVGTTNTKAILYDLKGQVLSQAYRKYPLYQDISGMAEEDPEDIFQATLQVIKQTIMEAAINGKDVLAISWSTQQHSLLALDANYQPLTRVITWADNRAADITHKFQVNGQGLQIYQRTGLPIHPMGPIYKLLWLKQENSSLFHKAAYWVGIKEYLIWRYTGKLQEEPSMASSTGLMNLQTLAWDSKILEAVGIQLQQLPRLVPITAKIKGIKSQYAQTTGLNPDLITVMGATDGALSTLGLGGIDSNILTINVGTSAAVRTVVERPLLEKNGNLFCYPITNTKYLIGGPLNNGGIVFNWAKNTLFPEQSITADLLNMSDYSLLTKIASTSPTGANGLLFLPYLGGERAPLWNSNARGTFYGLNRSHTRADMARAVIEGIIFNIYTVAECLIKMVALPKTILVTGGFVQSPFMAQTLADIFQQPILTTPTRESGCLAAMFLAKLSLGLENDFTDIKKYIGTTQSFKPNTQAANNYHELLSIFTKISQNLNHDYDLIANYQKKYQNMEES